MIETPILALFFLFGSSLITGISSSLQRMGKAQAETLAKAQKGLAKYFFNKSKRDLLSYALPVTKNLLLLVYTICAFDFAFPYLTQDLTSSTFVLFILILIGSSLLLDYLFRIISLSHPETFFRASCQIASFFLLLFWPLTFLLFRTLHTLVPKTETMAPERIREKILEILHDSEFAPHIDQSDQKLIISVITFKERIAREVMVPRVDMYTLSADTPIREAAKGLLEEGYSRIPVWKETMDNIIGTLYQKDLMPLYFETGHDLDNTIESLIKPIVYTPETKKISFLLQEFRTKQIHLAIVVNEYGGTEGIVTIEDILEELVGEIADEYDFDEEALFHVLPSGGWIIDAKMPIIDIEEELGLTIPQSPEYDSIGGFVFHKAGAIPSQGWKFHHDNFDLEILSSNERAIEKIKVIPH